MSLLSAGVEIAASLLREISTPRDRDAGMLNDFSRLCRAVKSVDGEGKAHQGEHNEGHPFQQHDCRRAGAE